MSWKLTELPNQLPSQASILFQHTTMARMALSITCTAAKAQQCYTCLSDPDNYPEITTDKIDTDHYLDLDQIEELPKSLMMNFNIF